MNRSRSGDDPVTSQSRAAGFTPAGLVGARDVAASFAIETIAGVPRAAALLWSGHAEGSHGASVRRSPGAAGARGNFDCAPPVRLASLPYTLAAQRGWHGSLMWRPGEGSHGGYVWCWPGGDKPRLLVRLAACLRMPAATRADARTPALHGTMCDREMLSAGQFGVHGRRMFQQNTPHLQYRKRMTMHVAVVGINH